MAPTILCISACLIVGKTLSDLDSLLPRLTQQLHSLELQLGSASASVHHHHSLSADPLEKAPHSQMCLLLSLAHPRYSTPKTHGIHGGAQPSAHTVGIQCQLLFIPLSHFAL